jgi:hypothetical protein
LVPGPNEVSNLPHEIWQDFQRWGEMLLGLELTEDQLIWVQGELRFFEQATTKLAQSWQQYHVWEKEAHEFLDHNYYLIEENYKNAIKADTEKWLQYFLRIEEMDKLLPGWQPENKMIRHVITQGYELMFKFMINFKDMRLISEEDLSIFLNKETDGQIVTGYAAWSHFDPIEGPPLHQNIKENLLINRSVYGLPDILKCES